MEAEAEAEAVEDENEAEIRRCESNGFWGGASAAEQEAKWWLGCGEWESDESTRAAADDEEQEWREFLVPKKPAKVSNGVPASWAR